MCMVTSTPYQIQTNRCRYCITPLPAPKILSSVLAAWPSQTRRSKLEQLVDPLLSRTKNPCEACNKARPPLSNPFLGAELESCSPLWLLEDAGVKPDEQGAWRLLLRHSPYPLAP